MSILGRGMIYFIEFVWLRLLAKNMQAKHWKAIESKAIESKASESNECESKASDLVGSARECVHASSPACLAMF